MRVTSFSKFAAAFMAIIFIAAGLGSAPANASSTGSVSFSVYFNGDSQQLSDAAKSTLTSKYRTYSKRIASVDIKGYVRAEGSGKAFVTLASNRAKSVSTFLKKLGVKASIKATGVGAPPTGGMLSTARRATITFTLKANTPSGPQLENQTISWTNPSNFELNTATNLIVSASSGLPVTVTSTTPSICTVSLTNGTWVVTPVALGSCALRATQAGDSTYKAATAAVSTVSVVAVKYQVTATAGTGGSIAPSGSSDVTEGADSSVYVITPDSGYVVDQLTVDGNSLTGQDLTDALASGIKFTNVTSDHTIQVTFALDQVAILASAGPNGTISNDGEVDFARGSNATYTFTANSGYEVDVITVDGVNLTGTDLSNAIANGYTFTNVQGDHTIDVTFKVYVAPTFMFRASGGWDEGVSGMEYSATCNGTSVSANAYINDCTSVQITLNYSGPGQNPPGGWPLTDGLTQWQYVYASPGLTCTPTIGATQAVFDCMVSGKNTYFVAMGVAVAWGLTGEFGSYSTAYVLDHNKFAFFQTVATYDANNNVTGGNFGSFWSSTNGIKMCRVVDDVTTTDCITIGTNTSWQIRSGYSPTSSTVWEFSIDGTPASDDVFQLWDRMAATYIATLDSATPVRLTLPGGSFTDIVWVAPPV